MVTDTYSGSYLLSNKTINISAFAVSLIVVIGGIFGVIEIAIERNVDPSPLISLPC
jgi:hypothetical protein